MYSANCANDKDYCQVIAFTFQLPYYEYFTLNLCRPLVKHPYNINYLY